VIAFSSIQFPFDIFNKFCMLRLNEEVINLIWFMGIVGCNHMWVDFCWKEVEMACFFSSLVAFVDSIHVDQICWFWGELECGSFLLSSVFSGS